MKIIKILFFAIIPCVMAGCTKESLSPQDGSQQTLSLKVETPSAAAESDEDIISDARIIAFRNANTLDANSGMKTIAAGGSITQTVTSGTRDIYVFANESRVQGMTAQLDGVRTLSALQAIQVPYSVDIAPPFLSSMMETKTLTDNTSMTANVVRTVSKVVLTIKYEWGTQSAPDFGYLDIDRVQVKNLPPFSYLIAQPYTQTAYVNSKVIEGADLDDITPDGFIYQSKPLTIYIPEFIGANDAAGRHAYLEIVGHHWSLSGISTSTYRMPLSSNMAADGTITGTNYDIARNTAFTIDATIKDFGELDNIAIVVEIEGWQTVGSTPEDVGEYLIVAETTKPLKFTIKEDIAIKASDLSKVKISSKNNKLDWTLSGNTISVGVKDEFATDEPQAAIDELIITLGQFTRRVNIDYRPSVAQRFAKGNIVFSTDYKSLTIGAYNTPHRYDVVFKWSTYIGMRTCDDSSNPLPVAQVVYKPAGSGITTPTEIIPYPILPEHMEHVGQDKDFLKFLNDQPGLVNLGYGDPCRQMGKVDGKYWRTPTGVEWKELLEESPLVAGYKERGKVFGLGGYVPQGTGGTSATMPANANYGWFFGPSATAQTDPANPAKGSVFIYQKYYAGHPTGSMIVVPTQNIHSSSAYSNENSYYYTANDVGGSIGIQSIKTNCFAVRCIQQ